MFENEHEGKLYMVSGTAVADFKRGINPLNIQFLIQLDGKVEAGCGRWSVRWFSRHLLEQAPCGTIIPEHLPANAIMVGCWDVSSISDDADSDEVPDFLAAAGNNPGHVHMLCEILQFMSQGRTVAISGVSAG